MVDLRFDGDGKGVTRAGGLAGFKGLGSLEWGVPGCSLWDVLEGMGFCDGSGVGFRVKLRRAVHSELSRQAATDAPGTGRAALSLDQSDV